MLGLGFPTLVPHERRRRDDGRRRDGREAGRAHVRRRPEELARAAPGRARHTPTRADPADPTSLHDVFFRIGGATPGKATTQPGREQRQRDPRRHLGLAGGPRQRRGLDGQHGRHRRHRQRRRRDGVRPVRRALPEVRGDLERQTMARSSSSRTRCPTTRPARRRGWRLPRVDGWAAFKVADSVTSFSGYGMGSYSFFNQGVDIFAAHAFEVPSTLPAGEPPRSAHDLPRSECREGRHPQRGQRHRRVVDHRQPGRPGHRRELPVSRPPASRLLCVRRMYMQQQKTGGELLSRIARGRWGARRRSCRRRGAGRAVGLRRRRRLQSTPTRWRLRKMAASAIGVMQWAANSG